MSRLWQINGAEIVMIMYIPKPKEWFIERIGQKIYRDKLPACCETCERVESEGLIIGNEQHARLLADLDANLGAEGQFCNYRDIS